MSITTLNNFSKNLNTYLDDVITTENKVYIATENGNAVLISEKELSGLLETLYLYSIPGMKEKIEEGIATPLEDCVEFDWRKELKD